MATKRVQNISPLGALDLVVDGQPVTVAHGETLEVSADGAKSLLAQPDVWREPKPGPVPAPKEDKE